MTSRSSIWDKVRCYWEHIREQTRNLMNNGWKPIKSFDRNTLGTWWEHIGNSKYPKSSTLPTLPKMKKKKKKHWVYWLHVTIPQLVEKKFSVHHLFGPSLIGKGMNCGNVTQGAFTLGVRDSKVESPNIMLLPI